MYLIVENIGSWMIDMIVDKCEYIKRMKALRVEKTESERNGCNVCRKEATLWETKSNILEKDRRGRIFKSKWIKV